MNRSKMLSCALPIALLISAMLAPACASNDGSTVPTADVNADQVEIVRGVPDRGRNPAVIAIDIGEVALCSGALVAPNVVLTARHCVSKTTESVQCPATSKQIISDRAPSSLKILVGDDIATAKAEALGKEVLTPESTTLCGDDIALIILDRAITGITPLEVAHDGVAKGSHVSAIGFGRSSDDGAAGTKLLRAHVKVLDTSASEFLVGESTCSGDSGGPALDEASGEIVGVVSRGGPSCEGTGAHNIYTRADVFLRLVDEAISRAAIVPPVKPSKDAGASPPKGSSKGPKPDFGGACQSGSDCSAGVCVNDHGKEYCSRSCDAHDRCPAHFHCATIHGGQQVCTET